MIRAYLEKLGRMAEKFVNTAGLMSIMLFQAAVHAFTPPIKFRNIFKQMEFVGVQSLFVVILTGSFTGMVLALQSFNALKRFGAESLVGPTVALSMARELGPVLTGLMVTGRAGSAMATELGTMRVTEQIDALYTMAVKMLGVNSGVYVGRTVDFVKAQDIFDGLIKASVFGLILSIVACYHGFNTTGGAAGVGESATKSVVMGCVLILVADYFLTSVMF